MEDADEPSFTWTSSCGAIEKPSSPLAVLEWPTRSSIPSRVVYGRGEREKCEKKKVKVAQRHSCRLHRQPEARAARAEGLTQALHPPPHLALVNMQASPPKPWERQGAVQAAPPAMPVQQVAAAAPLTGATPALPDRPSTMASAGTGESLARPVANRTLIRSLGKK